MPCFDFYKIQVIGFLGDEVDFTGSAFPVFFDDLVPLRFEKAFSQGFTMGTGLSIVHITLVRVPH